MKLLIVNQKNNTFAIENHKYHVDSKRKPTRTGRRRRKIDLSVILVNHDLVK